MSNRAIDAVKDFSKSKGSERLLLMMIADGINKSTGYYDAKISTLKADCNMSERWIQRLIPRLIARGELIVVDRPGFSSSFAIPIYEGEQGYDPLPCDSDQHTCTGEHTPLSVNREDVRRDEWSAQRRRQRQSRKVQGVNDSAPPGVNPSAPPSENDADEREGVNDSTPPGERECTPRVNDSTPPGERECTPSTPSLTLSLLPIDVPGASSPHQKKEKAARTETPDTPPPPPPSHEPLSPPGYVWSRTIEYLRTRNLGSAALANWIVPLRLTEIVNAGREVTVYLQAPSSDHARIVEQRYHGLIANGIGGVFGLPASRVKLIVFKAAPRVSGDTVEVAQA